VSPAIVSDPFWHERATVDVDSPEQPAMNQMLAKCPQMENCRRQAGTTSVALAAISPGELDRSIGDRGLASLAFAGVPQPLRLTLESARQSTHHAASPSFIWLT